MVRKTKSTISPPAIAPSVGPEKTLARLQRLLEQIQAIRVGGDGSPLTIWRQDVRVVLSQFYGRPSLELEHFESIQFSPSFYTTGMSDSIFTEARLSGLATAEGFLKSRIADLAEDTPEGSPVPTPLLGTAKSTDARKVFIVHGHAHGQKETVARYLTKLGLEPIILHEQADQGRTIIEKFEHNADVACAVVILSPDDIVSSESDLTVREQRARQNVIFEMGFFIGRLGRTHTFALVEKGVSRPSDIDGVIYIPMDDDTTWRILLVRELKAAGISVDANSVFG